MDHGAEGVRIDSLGGCGDVAIALSAIAAAFALYHRFRAVRALKRLKASLEDQRAKDGDHDRTDDAGDGA